MELENLEKGMIIKNYKELCKILSVKYCAGNEKKRQLEWISEYISYNRDGHKYIIDDIYEEKPLEPQIDKRIFNSGKNRKGAYGKYKNFCVDKQYWNDIGVYAIVLDDYIYIGSTAKGFRERFMKHRESKGLITRDMLINHNADFKILEICNNMSEPQIRERENYWIHFYKNNPNWSLINKRKAWSYTTGTKSNKVKNKKKRKKCNVQIQIYEDEYYQFLSLLIDNGYDKYIK